jgi:hypothetical protein
VNAESYISRTFVVADNSQVGYIIYSDVTYGGCTGQHCYRFLYCPNAADCWGSIIMTEGYDFVSTPPVVRNIRTPGITAADMQAGTKLYRLKSE